MRQAVFSGLGIRAEDRPPTVFIQPETVVGTRPETVIVYQHAIHVIVGKTIGSGEILPAEHWNVLRRAQ